MQISLILWPAASRWAQAVQSQDLIQQLLAEVSDIYRPLQNVAAGPAYPVIKQKRQQPA